VRTDICRDAIKNVPVRGWTSGLGGQTVRCVDRPARARVLVLYTHPLLGQGLANLLMSEASVDAIAVPADDAQARAAALDARPQLVIVEQADPARSFESSGSLPVVFVRLDGATATDGKRLSDPDEILELARALKVPVGAGSTV